MTVVAHVLLSAIVAQSVNGRYPEFYERKYRHEPRVYLSLSLGW